MYTVDAEIEIPKLFCPNFLLIIQGPETNLCTLWKQKYIYLFYFVLGLFKWLIQVVYIVEAKIQTWRIFFLRPGMTLLGLICVQCGRKNIDMKIFFSEAWNDPPWIDLCTLWKQKYIFFVERILLTQTPVINFCKMWS